MQITSLDHLFFCLLLKQWNRIHTITVLENLTHKLNDSENSYILSVSLKMHRKYIFETSRYRRQGRNGRCKKRNSY